MTERVRLQMQASKMRILQKIKGVTMFDKVRNTAIQESLNITVSRYFLGSKNLSFDGLAI